MNFWFLEPDLLERLDIIKDDNGKYQVRSNKSDKYKRAKTEEIIRQLVLLQLECHYHYSSDRLKQEYVVHMGVAKKRADIAIFDSNNTLQTIIEVKQLLDEDSVKQVKSYMHATNAMYGAVISPFDRKVFMRHNNDFHEISDLPLYDGAGDFEKVEIKKADISINNSQDIKLLMASLGIISLSRINESVSELNIKDQFITVPNIRLTSYNKVRKLLIGIGIVLQDNITKKQWDDLLSVLFEEATYKTTADDSPSASSILNNIIEPTAKEAMEYNGIIGLARIGNKTSMLKIKGSELLLQNNELYDYNKIRKKAIEAGIVLPSQMKRGLWDEILKLLFDTATVLDEQEVATPENKFKSLLYQFCNTAPKANTRIELLYGKVWLENGKIYFRSSDLMKYLYKLNFIEFKEKEIWGVLRRLGAKNNKFMLKGKCVGCWGITPEIDENFTGEKEIL